MNRRLDHILGLDPGLDTDPPCLPSTASIWETQEIRRHWRDSLLALHNVAESAVAQYLYLLTFDGNRFDYRPMGGTLGYQATQAEVALVNLSRVLDGAAHRAAVTTRGEPSARELIILKSAARLHDELGSNPDMCPCEHTHCILTEPWVPEYYRREGPPARVPKPAGA